VLPVGGRVGQVVEALRARIRLNGLGPGDALPSEHALAEELGVSRAAVREALQSMAALRLVDVGNGRRARVSSMDPSVLAQMLEHVVVTDQVSILQIMDFRRTVEMRTVALAALHRNDAEAAEIEAMAEAMRRDFDFAERVMEHDIAFHQVIAGASRNPLFKLIVGSFGVVTRQTWRVGWATRPDDASRADSVACHRAIAAAIRDGDPGAAQTQMAAHFDNTVRVLLAAGIH
jgi:DNA-binding FadR family transcriptional regulator